MQIRHFFFIKDHILLKIEIFWHVKGILKLILAYIFSTRDEGCFFVRISDGNRSHFQVWWSLYQHRPMIDHLWQLSTKCIYWLLLPKEIVLISRVCFTKVEIWIQLYRISTKYNFIIYNQRISNVILTIILQFYPSVVLTLSQYT
jgi:hypothetical protein